jgi:hypothetical protein
MTTTCWTIIHHAAAPVARGAARVAHAAYRIVRPAHRAAHLPRHAAPAVGPPHGWVEVVCRIVPAAIAGSGLLAPTPADPPRQPQPPPAIVQPAPPEFPWLFPPSSPTAPATPVQPYPTPVPVEATSTTGSELTVSPPAEPASPPVEPIPEPSSVGPLLGGAAGVLLIRLATRRTLPDGAPDGDGSAGGGEPAPSQAHLVGRHPVQ